MKNLKIINDAKLKDWAEDIFKKNSFNMIDVSSKKKLLEELWQQEKFMLGKTFLILL